MTELSFLLDLLLNHKLLTNTKKSVMERIQFIEGQMSVKTKPAQQAMAAAYAERNMTIQAAAAGTGLKLE